MADLSRWLDSLGLGRYAGAFEEHAIEWEHLPDLDHGALKEIGVSLLGHRMTLLKAASMLDAAAGAEPSPGHPVAPVRVAPTGEAGRRQLTVMFCDLVGSTRLATELDPEELADVMRAFQDRCAGCITRFGGYIARYMGDGLLVYFGFPQAFEDGPQRAVHAGRAIVDAVKKLSHDLRDTVESGLAVRVGIATGMVVVGEIVGEGAAAESAVVGETPNLAARLQGVAGPDEVVVSTTTHHLIAESFECEDMGPQTLKGLAAPVTAWRVRADLSTESGSTPRRRGKGPPLIGRQEELGLLLRAWESSRAGHGQVVLINGEPGIGKSRLLQALRERLERTAYLWVPVHCSPYHQQSALHPVIEQLKRAFRWSDDDSATVRLERLEQALGRAGVALDEVVPLYASLLSLPLPEDRYPVLRREPQQQRQLTLDAVSGWLFAEAERQPVVQVWEDVHWADPSTLELLELFIVQAPTVPMLNVVTFRPEFAPPWSQRSHMTPITLSRFERDEAERLMVQLGGGKSFPAEVVEHVVGKADGVPLYVEELTKSIRDSELVVAQGERYVLTGRLSDMRIPATLQDTLMSRLDRVPAVRELAQLGAVLGREFDYQMLRSLANVDEQVLLDGLERLVAAELLYQRGRPPRARYIFKHALIQDAAYQSMLRRTRQQHHLRVATALEERFPDVVEANPDQVAQHLTEGGAPERALEYWHKAGDRALRQSANREAIGHLSRGLALLEKVPPSRARDQRELALQVAFGDANQSVLGMGAPEVAAAYGRALELGRTLGDTGRLYPVRFGAWRLHVMNAEFDKALDLASELAKQAEGDGAVLHHVFADYALGFTHLMRAELPGAAAHLDRALASYVPSLRDSPLFLAGQDPCEACGIYRAWLLWLRGFPDQALDQCTRALAYAESLGHPVTLAHALSLGAVVHQLRGDAAAVQRLSERNEALTTEHGMHQWRDCSRALRGWAMHHLGHGAGAIAEISRGIDGWSASGVGALVPYLMGLLADVLAQQGRLDEAAGVTEQALASTQSTGEHFNEAELHRLRGTQLAASDESAGLASLRTAFEIARSQGAKGWALRAATSLARSLHRQECGQEGLELLRTCMGGFSEGFGTADLVAARRLLAELSGGATGSSVR